MDSKTTDESKETEDMDNETREDSVEPSVEGTDSTEAALDEQPSSDAASATVDIAADEDQKPQVLTDSAADGLQERIDKLEAERQSIDAERRTLEAERKSIEVERQSLVDERKSVEADKAKLVSREQDVAKAEVVRNSGFADERAELDQELFRKRQDGIAEIAKQKEDALTALEEEIQELRSLRLSAVTSAESDERERIRAEIKAERDAWDTEREQWHEQTRKEHDEFEQRRGVVSAQLDEIERRTAEFEEQERSLEKKDDRLREQAERRSEKLDEEVEDRMAEIKRTYEASLTVASDDNTRIRESLQSQAGLLGAFEELKAQLGGVDPAVAIRDLNSKSDEIARLREELATRPTDEMRQKYQEVEQQLRQKDVRIEELTRQVDASRQSVDEANTLRFKLSELRGENELHKQKATIFEGMANEATAELERLRAAYERPAEIEVRKKEIELPYIKASDIAPPQRDDALTELKWLNGIGNACENYGLHFNPRLLRAFHTALKTAEWSPLTVLAGVSGTGKSELPRLYAHFGGLFSDTLSVQPNWDSQESMLGFFNTIDNRFDAQPVLRFLAQSQKQWIEAAEDTNGYPGLNEMVCLVLLDEMNLAHPELYFAEFLSKLELRRGMKGADVPTLPVKIGAGMPAYPLPLGRNVLWAGTMNQDETTKSLSDKVLDRSIVIHFPRPTELKRRQKLAPLDEKNRGKTLHVRTWQRWLSQESCFTDEEVRPYKSFIEEINKSLGIAGRAIGHRVWQSIEYYMSNYPDVGVARATGDEAAIAKAMHYAFEDQLVQKVMPKLRGIDTRGKSKDECLDKIRQQLVEGIGGNKFNLEEDFDLACELGYGQFIWQSANYLTDESFTAEYADSSDEASGESAGYEGDNQASADSDVETPDEWLEYCHGDQVSAANAWSSFCDAVSKSPDFDISDKSRIHDALWIRYTPEQREDMMREFAGNQ